MSEIRVSTVLVPLGDPVWESVPCVSLRFLCWPANLGIPWLGENMAPISAPHLHLHSPRVCVVFTWRSSYIRTLIILD